MGRRGAQEGLGKVGRQTAGKQARMLRSPLSRGHGMWIAPPSSELSLVRLGCEGRAGGPEKIRREGVPLTRMLFKAPPLAAAAEGNGAP